MKLRSYVRRLSIVSGMALLLGAAMVLAISWSASGAPPIAARSRASAAMRVPSPAQATSPVASSQAISRQRQPSAADAARAVRLAWERARAAGAYHFASDLTQLHYAPNPVGNGQSTPERAELYLEGDIDLEAGALQMKLWTGEGSVAGAVDGAEMRVEDGKAYVRQLAGGAWRETEDLSGSFAPDGDALAFLAGIKNVAEVAAPGSSNAAADKATSAGSPIVAARYAFEIDGPGLARYMRDRFERQLLEQGRLPYGVTIDTPQQYREATGYGEIWLDRAGLPVRLAIHLVYPAVADGSHVEADVRTDFSGWPAQAAAAPSLFDGPVAWVAASLDPVEHRAAWTAAGRLLAVSVFGLVSLAVLAGRRRMRHLYAAVVVAVIFSMVVVPLLQSERLAAFMGEQNAEMARQAQQQADQEAARQAKAEIAGPAWDPNRDPSATAQGPGTEDGGGQPSTAQPSAPNVAYSTTTVEECDPRDTTDLDEDGVNNYEECRRGLGTDAASMEPDTDHDGLLDGLEIYQVGTNVKDSDSDGDLIPDAIEIAGYFYSGKTWYLDPLNPDTNNDGVPDSAECVTLTVPSQINAATVMSECDTDQDGTPDPFDLDNDGDGVPDLTDLSPSLWTDRNGVHQSGFNAGSAAPFDGTNSGTQRFALAIEGLRAGWPALVDIQLRPITPTHLSYALNILDWPSNVVEGQIQHVRKSTFASSIAGNPSDEAGSHGDMRLVPLLEIEMNGTSLPLKLTGPAAAVQVGSGMLSTTVSLNLKTGDATKTELTFTFTSGTPTVKLYSGGCPAKGALLQTFAGITTGTSTTSVVNLADGNHAVVVEGGGSSACAVLPNVVNGPYADKMVDMSVYEPYGISVREVNNTLNTPLLIYVPLNLVSDDTGGGKAAFRAHMFYQPATTARWTQQIRVVWAVQALTDDCNTSGFPADLKAYQNETGQGDATQDDYDAAYKAYCARPENRTPDSLQIVQTYDDSFYVTGVAVREDHGMWVAAAYENPAAHSTYPVREDDIWQLSQGLSTSFLAQRDCEDGTGASSYDPANSKCSADGKRDLTIAEKDTAGVSIVSNSTIGKRFDANAPITTTYTITDRWGIEWNALRVQTVHYAHQDEMAYVPTQLTPGILRELEGRYGTGIEPTILFAREEYFRSADLGAGMWDPAQKLLTVNIDPNAYPEQLITSMNWSPFRFNNATDPVTNAAIGWEGTPITTRWGELEDEFGAYFADLYPAQTEEERQANEGRMAAVQSYYAALVQGLVIAEDPCPGLSCKYPPTSNSSADLAKGVKMFGKGATQVAVLVAEEIYLAIQRWAGNFPVPPGFAPPGAPNWQTAFLAAVAKHNKALADGSGPLTAFRRLPSGGRMFQFTAIAAGVAVAAALGCLIAIQIKNHAGSTMAVVGTVLQGLGIITAGFGVVTSMGKMLKLIVGDSLKAVAAKLSTNLANLKGSTLGCKAFGWVVMAATIVLNFMSLVVQQFAGGLAVGSLAWDNVLAGAIAGAIATLVLFLIFTALGPIGGLLQSIFGLVDALVGMICSLTGAAKKSPTTAKWLCGGLTGLVTNILKFWIYGGDLIVDMQDPERLQLSNFGIDLVDEARGMVVGNSVRFNTALTNTIKLAPIPSDSLYANVHSYAWNTNNLKRSSFRYNWTLDSQAKLHEDMDLDEQTSEWLPATSESVYYTKTIASSHSFKLEQAGLVTPSSVILAEGYAVPENECWGLFPFAYCSIVGERNTNRMNLGKNLVFTVLPATLDGFRSLAAKGQGWALDWGNLDFPVLYDADGDGLPSVSDPNDQHADMDNDGLWDGYEIEVGSDPVFPDSDGDGLFDGDELRTGANPKLRDSDGDGLSDGDEVAGWEFVYGLDGSGYPLKQWVWPDPLRVDADGDGLTDRQEYIFGYHPGVESKLNVLSLTSEITEQEGSGSYAATDGVVKPGQTLHYTSTVRNELYNRETQGLLSAEAPGALDTSGIPPRSFVLRGQEETTTAGALVVKSTAASGVYSLTHVAGALVANWIEPSHGARLWLTFDDAARPYTDRSGSLPPHDGACVAQPFGYPTDPCSLDSGGRFGSALKLPGSGYGGVYVHTDAGVPQTGYAASAWFKTMGNGPLLALESASGARVASLILSSYSELCGHVTMASYADQVCGKVQAYNDGQWHHVVHTFGEVLDSSNTLSRNQKIYVDGALVATGEATQGMAPGASFDIGGTPYYAETLPGLIDDVRLYDHQLTPSEVGNLYNQPLFLMNFDQPNMWQDVSSYNATVSCTATSCPSHDAQGRASFGGAQWLATQGTELNLSNARFTLSAWIFPQKYEDARDAHPQGILGYHSGENDAYPILERVGDAIRFGVGTGSAWKEWISGSVLALKAWNHVVLTFDRGTLKLYVNGTLKQQDATAFAGVTAIAATKQFDIGRSTDQSTLTVTKFYNDKLGDGATCGALFESEICMAIDGVQVVDREGVRCDTLYPVSGASRSFRERGSLMLWEDDPGGVHCGAVPDSGDDVDANSPHSYTSSQIGNGTEFTANYTNAGTGTIYLKLSNRSIPFNGSIDDVGVYGYVMDDGAVAKLYQPTNLGLRLPLDDPPGTTAFSQASAVREEAACTSCPTAGLAGRMDQAASFNGTSDYLQVPNGPINRLVSGFSVAAWINPRSVTGLHTIVATSRQNSNNGWGFGIEDGNLRFAAYNRSTYSIAASLQINRWYHVAAVVDPATTVRFYLNGALLGNVTGPVGAWADTDDNLLVGAHWATGGSGPGQLFNGLLDDVQVYGQALTADQVKAVYDQAPKLQLRLDEAQGATSFADSASNGARSAVCTGTACPATGEAVKGQIGLAARFDGENDLVTLTDATDALDFAHFTVGGWVKPDGVSSDHQAVLAKYAPGGKTSYNLAITGGSLLPFIQWGCQGASVLSGSTPLVKGNWNHLLATYDGIYLRLYVNGAETNRSEVGALGACSGSGAPLAIGGNPQAPGNGLAGALDNLVIYNRALSGDDVQMMYAYQSSWIEDRQSRNLVVDGDNPTAEVEIADGAYLPVASVVVLITTADASSDVASAQLCVGGACSAADHCTDPSRTTAWCPTFAPSAEGVYSLTAKATDRVGHTAESAARTVRVDDTPPSITLNGSAGQRLNAVRDDDNNWMVHLSGTASDPALGTGVPGSGVPAGGVQVTLHSADGGLAGPAGQVASLSGSNWSLDYVLSESKPAGCYTVTVSAVDALAATPGLDAAQVARHTSTLSRLTGINATAPAVAIDRAALDSGSIASTATTLGGVASARPRPVRVAWTTGASGAGASLVLTCSGPGSPATYAPYKATAGAFQANQSYSWGGQIQQGVACSLRLIAAADSAGIIGGTVSVCGEQIKSWTDDGSADRTISFTVSSTACPADACAGTVATAGVGGVDVALTPLMPGSAFLNETPPAGEVLHLPFNEGAGATAFRDASTGHHDATCSGGACPSAGQAGHTASAAAFDGVNDRVDAGSGIGLANKTFSISFWAKRTKLDIQQTVIGQGTGSTNAGLTVGFKSGNQFVCGFYGNDLSTASAYTDTGWHNWTCTYDATSKNRTIYRDGIQVAQAAATANYQGSGNLFIGASSTGSCPFTGLLDEVRIFDHALTASEANALYLGSAPLLQLDFEKAVAVDGATLPDSSGWGHDATLHIDAGDVSNKIVAGQVGAHALALQADGWGEDYVDAGDIDEVDALGDFTISQWFMLDTLGGAYYYHDWAALVGKDAFNAAKGWAVLLNRDANTAVDHLIRLYINGAPAKTLNAPGYVWQTGRWYHYAFTRSGNTIAAYLDGQYKSSVSNPAVPGANSAPLLVGKDTAQAGYAWRGKLDDLRIYARALSAQEVQELYNAGWRSATLDASGAATQSTRWTLDLPAGLEGSYRVDLRSSDAAGHVEMAPVWNTDSLASPTWSAEADTTAPRVTLCREAIGSSYRYVAVAQDYNLVETGFSSPCAPSSRTYFGAPWFVTAVAAGTQKLYQVKADCQPASAVTERAKACDSAGNCTTVGLTTGGLCDAILAAGAGTDQDARTAASLASGAVAPAAAITEAHAYAGQPQAPVIVFASTVLTTTHFYPPRGLAVTGLVTGASALAGLEVAVDGSTGPAAVSDGAPAWPFTRTWSYTHQLPDGLLPDGITMRAVVTATLPEAAHAAAPAASAADAPGQRLFLPLVLNAQEAQETYSVEETLTVDVVPPAAVDLVLTADGAAVDAGETVCTSEPEFVLNWTASSDGSGLEGYETRWAAVSAATMTVSSRAHDTVGVLEDRYTAGEAERLTVELGIRDRYGNATWQALGPVYVDGPATPDIIDLGEPGSTTYDGWMESSCTLVGGDRRLYRSGLIDSPQQLYASWDQRALRLAWTGANWNGDGDLFVYLDTGAGGTEQVFTPYATSVTGTMVALPASMGADVLVWVQDPDRASLLRWDGSSWGGAMDLTEMQYRFDAGKRGGQTDLYLPFDLLGLVPASSLGLLAFATEEPAEGQSLELWATLPLLNPVNSPRVSRWAGLAGEGVHFSLLRAYRWSSLAAGICPNGTGGALESRFGDNDLQITLTPEPAGVAFGGLGNGLFWLPDPAPAASVGADLPTFQLLHPSNAPVPDGQTVTYTVHYHNLGSQAMAGVRLELSPHGQLRLLDQSVDLGDIPPGGTGEAVFHAVIDRSLGGLPIAAVKGLVYDAGHGSDGSALEWLWAAHRVDKGGPETPILDLPARIGPSRGRLMGAALDDAGVREVDLDVQWPGGGKQITCAVTHPAEGQWSCDWETAAPLPDETPLTVRARATDIHGQMSEWSEPRTVTVDARPPDITFNVTATGILPALPVAGNSLTLYGTAVDAGDVTGVSVCLGDLCGRAELRPGAAAAENRWLHRIPALPALDFVTRTLTFIGTDSLGNRTGEPIAHSLVVDNVAPVLVSGQVQTQVALGSTTTVLAGTISDGGPSVAVSVRVRPPVGDTVRMDATVQGGDWRFDLAASLAGRYTLWVDAEDLAGNRTTAGPFEVDITCVDANLAMVSLAAEPLAGSTDTLVLSAVISNTGPGWLPGGVPVAFFARGAPIGTVTTTLPLAPGEALPLALAWAPGSTGDWDLTVAATASVGEGTILCAAPDPVHFAVSTAYLSLFTGWNLVSSPVEPFNTGIEAVQRPIQGTYAAILGYEDGPRWYDPLGSDPGDLAAIEAGRGYWIRETLVPTMPQPGDEDQGEPSVAAWRLAGSAPPEDQPLPLLAGWNLAGYLPRTALPVTVALQAVDGAYTAVLGFDRTAVSYYPGLESGYNTLQTMAPAAGYWISATHAVTLHYPLTQVAEMQPITASITMTEAVALKNRMVAIRTAETEAGVEPTYTWLNLYGQVYLPDGSPAPVSSTVTVLANGSPCGATVVTEPGRFGLLACYGDDQTTEGVDSAHPGDVISLYLDGAAIDVRPVSFNGQPTAGGHRADPITWTAHGDRWEVALGNAPLLADLAIAKAVSPGKALPGAAITYTLAYSNAGGLPAQSVVITDQLPLEIIYLAFTEGGMLEEGGEGRIITWQLAEVAAGAGGTLTVTGRLDPALTGSRTITNTAGIASLADAWPGNNRSAAVLQLIEVEPVLNPSIWLPLILQW